MIEHQLAAVFRILAITTPQEAEERMARIREKNEHWRECADGSWEMAMTLDGYYVLEALRREMLEKATGAAREGSGYASTDPQPVDATEGHRSISPGCPEL